MEEFSRSQAVKFTSKVVVSILKRVLDKDVVIRKWYAVRPFNSSNCYDLGCMSRSFIDCKLIDKRVAQSLCHSRASCYRTSLSSTVSDIISLTSMGSFSSYVTRMLRQKMLSLNLSYIPFSNCTWLPVMLTLHMPNQHIIFEVSSFSHSRNIVEEQVTWHYHLPCPFQGWFIVRMLRLICYSQPTRQIWILYVHCYKDTKGNAKCRN